MATYNLDTENVTAVIEHSNVAEMLSEQELEDIGAKCVEAFEVDLQSRSEWTRKNEKWLKLGLQVAGEKTFPWPKASNVQYPLLTTTAMQFHARAHQNLVQGNQLVNCKVNGRDEDGEKVKRCRRVESYMSYQLLEEMEEFQEDMDRLLFILPFIGLCFKKTYFSTVRGRNVSELVLPMDLVINYHAQDFKRARKTHILYKDKNEVVENILKGYYLDVDLEDPGPHESRGVKDENQGLSPSALDEDAPYEILEQHYMYDLDGDGYKEPYIITVDRASRKVLRIVARFDGQGLEYNQEGELVGIQPVEYFTRYFLLPDPESKIYALGFGSLLGPMNKAVNTLINQLIDAGTLGVLPSGFLARGVRNNRGGSMRFKAGEWKNVATPGEDLRKGVFPLPIKEPSAVLFQVLSFLVQSGEKIGAVQELMMGESPGQNQPYSTTSAVLEQGLKVFSGIYKRIYRSLGEEYKKLFRLNSIYLQDEHYVTLLDTEEQAVTTAADFDMEGMDISPSADPDLVTEQQKLLKAEALLQKDTAGFPINPTEATKRALEAEQHEAIAQLMNVPPPQPDFELQFKMKQHEDEMQLRKADLAMKVSVSQFESLKDQAQAMKSMADAQGVEGDLDLRKMQMAMDAMQSEKDEAMKSMDVVMKMLDLQAKDKDIEIKEKEANARQAAQSSSAGQS